MTTLIDKLLADELQGWTIEFGKDNYCWQKEKRICVKDKNSIGMLLHETAHALCIDFDKNIHGEKHHGYFADKFTMLIDKYLIIEQKALLEEK